MCSWNSPPTIEYLLLCNKAQQGRLMKWYILEFKEKKKGKIFKEVKCLSVVLKITSRIFVCFLTYSKKVNVLILISYVE